MDKGLILDLIFGTVTVSAFIFSIYTHYKNKSKKEIEAAKNATHLERIRTTKNSLGGIFNTIDMIIQIPKSDEISIKQIQNMARIVRHQILVISKQLEMEENQLKEWEYGKVFTSQNFLTNKETKKENNK